MSGFRQNQPRSMDKMGLHDDANSKQPSYCSYRHISISDWVTSLRQNRQIMGIIYLVAPCLVAVTTGQLGSQDLLDPVQRFRIPKFPKIQAAEVEATGLIPHRIWQINLPKPSFLYTLVGQRGGDKFVDTHSTANPALLSAHHELQNNGMKSDLRRYLLLSAQGGLYTDTDTRCATVRLIGDQLPGAFRDGRRQHDAGPESAERELDSDSAMAPKADGTGSAFRSRNSRELPAQPSPASSPNPTARWVRGREPMHRMNQPGKIEIVY
ncbi:Uu.00g019730.m01.CDS01 [Anthostomella pinea]|uniref:Uu.00g019730.m01.CDS01 n=1 Tax=Anthostomella pinea TaxID=933095 RepID=A0AAI8VZB9_9PEZI|nr:Uu.00g019730.m01.CDS01 [Anthostomella pinea]